MRLFANTPWKPGEWSIVHPLLERHREHKNNEPDYIGGRILAAEVKRLRALLVRCADEMHDHGGLLAFETLHDLQSEPFIQTTNQNTQLACRESDGTIPHVAKVDQP